MFTNEKLNEWIDEKSRDIMNKSRNGKISSDDMLILCLEAQSNNFNHLHKEIREEFRFINRRFELIDQRFDQFEKRFDSQIKIILWGLGLVITSNIFGKYLT